MSKARLLEHADTLAHKILDPYINRHLPGWGHLQAWMHRLCDAYERANGWL